MLNETLEYIGIAFVSSAILIVLSKIILQFLIRRPADYYNAAELYQEELMLNSAGLSINDEMETNPEGELTGENIHVDPKISVEQAAEMHLIDKEIMPGLTAEEKSGPEAEDLLPEVPDEHDEHKENLEDIRKSLEEAYKQQIESLPEAELEVPAEPEEPQMPAEPEKPARRKTGKRKPSMRMNKAELIEIAESMGIELPDKATKKVILDLIYENMNED